MIAVKRPAPTPAFVKPDGRAVRARAALAALFAADPDLAAGTTTPAWTSSIWSGAKARFIKAQHGKCVFCESPFTAVAHGDVEHFRPKSGFNDSHAEDLTKPGYWWLAYEWSNYWASCQICNQSHKRNLFPLGAGGIRARGPGDDLLAERPLMLDPAVDDPSAHIEFRDEFVFARGGSVRGAAAIRIVGLDRPDLQDARRERHKWVAALLEVRRELAGLPETLGRVERLLKDAIDPSQPYSAMVIDLFRREAPELLL